MPTPLLEHNVFPREHVESRIAGLECYREASVHAVPKVRGCADLPSFDQNRVSEGSPIHALGRGWLELNDAGAPRGDPWPCLFGRRGNPGGTAGAISSYAAHLHQFGCPM